MLVGILLSVINPEVISTVIGAFISTLMMVGIVTAPVEIKYFGKKLTIARNILAFVFSFIVAYIIGKVANGI